MKLPGKTIILTGAARIGKTVGEELSRNGANLVVVYFHKKPDLDLKSGAIFVQANLSKAGDVTRVVEEAKREFGKIHGLVHMAATYKRNPWDSLNEAAFDIDIDDILKSAFLMSKAVGDEIKDSGGKIVLISDWSVLDQPYKDYLPYNVAKAGIVGLTKSLAKELAPKVSVNCVAPGPILKPPDLQDLENEEVMKNTPLERWGGAGEIAKGILYLLDSDFMTGQVLYIDGGRSIS
ncbi:MAG: SDR family oxidoreductase [Candidatus Doudnabacteria bacterium]|nr:SDR family oxidoreductase [Candidatus Doudnabacteria bacterium]